MRVQELKKDLFYTGVFDYDLRVFDIIMTSDYGTTYNSYVVKGSEKTALIETSKLEFVDDYIKAVSEICDFKEIDYLIMNHSEPDHAGSICKILELNPEITIVASAVGLNFISEIVNCAFNKLVAKEQLELDLGDKKLQFIMAPNLHWPDTMYTYCPELTTLFTCDSFGAHYACELLRSEIKDETAYRQSLKYYYDHIMGPFKQPFMHNALNKIKKIRFDLICPGHGPVLDEISEALSLYEYWTKPQETEASIVIAYVSSYGYTKQLADVILQGVQETGIKAYLYDLQTADIAEVKEKLLSAKGIILGSPTILNEALPPVLALTNDFCFPLFKGKYATSFGSYGWSGEACDHLNRRFEEVKMKVSAPLKVKFKPNTNDLKDALDFGYQFALQIKK